MKIQLKKKVLLAALIPAFGMPLSTVSLAQTTAPQPSASPQSESQQDVKQEQQEAQQAQQEAKQEQQEAKQEQQEAKQEQQQAQQQESQPQQAQAEQQKEKSQQVANIRDMRASEIIGASVQDSNGEELGDIQDLIVDAEQGKINYAIVASGGVLGFGEKLFAYPMDRFQPAGEGDQLALNVAKEELKNAPGFDKSNWPTWGSGGYRGEVDKHFGQTAKQGGNLVRMSEIMDQQVSDQAGNEVGQIEDVVASVKDGQVQFVALTPAEQLNLGDNQIAMIPMSAIRATSQQQFEQQAQQSQGQSQPGQPQDQTMASGESQQQSQTSGGSQQESQSTGLPPKTSAQEAQQQQSSGEKELQLVLNIAPEELTNARTFEEGQWPDLNDQKFQQEMESYVASFPTGGQTATGSSGGESKEKAGASEEKLEPKTGASASEPSTSGSTTEAQPSSSASEPSTSGSSTEAQPSSSASEPSTSGSSTEAQPSSSASEPSTSGSSTEAQPSSSASEPSTSGSSTEAQPSTSSKSGS